MTEPRVADPPRRRTAGARRAAAQSGDQTAQALATGDGQDWPGSRDAEPVAAEREEVAAAPNMTAGEESRSQTQRAVAGRAGGPVPAVKQNRQVPVASAAVRELRSAVRYVDFGPKDVHSLYDRLRLFDDFLVK